MRSKPKDPRFAETVFVVEATSFERHCLWKEFSAQAGLGGKCDWQQDFSGLAVRFGRYLGVDLLATVTWAVIDGKRVLFWESTSDLFRHSQGEAAIYAMCGRPTWDRGTRPARCNAMNFHHCLDAIHPETPR